MYHVFGLIFRFDGHLVGMAIRLCTKLIYKRWAINGGWFWSRVFDL